MSALSCRLSKRLHLGAKAAGGFLLTPNLDSGDFAVLHGDCASLMAFAQVTCSAIQQGSPVIFVDGGNSFDPYLVADLVRGKGLNPKEFLEKIYVSRAFTAHQLYSLIIDRLEAFADRVGAGLIVVSDIASLFFHGDVPDSEAKELFLKIVMKLAEIVTKKQIVVLATYIPKRKMRRRIYFEAALFGRSNVLIEFARMGSGMLRLTLKRQTRIEPFVVGITPHASLMEYMEVPGFG